MVKNTKPLTAMVYDYVYGEITNGNLTSNDILTESALVSQMQVSKSPVREALILLCEENVLQVIPRIGYRVVQVTPEQVRQLIEARFALEPFLFEKAWPNIGEAEMAQLEALAARCKAEEPVQTSISDNWRRNIEFHMLLCGFSGNAYLLDMLRRTLKTCARAANQYYINVRGIPCGDTDHHDAIVEAIRARDYARSLAILLEDIREIIPSSGVN